MADFLFEHEYRNRMWRLQPTYRDGEHRLNFWAWFPTRDGWRPCKGNEVGFVLSREAACDLRDELTAHLDKLEVDLGKAA